MRQNSSFNENVGTEHTVVVATQMSLGSLLQSGRLIEPMIQALAR